MTVNTGENIEKRISADVYRFSAYIGVFFEKRALMIRFLEV